MSTVTTVLAEVTLVVMVWPAWWVLVWAAGCGPPARQNTDGLVLLEPTDHLVRASMAVRGTRPTVEELRQVQADPGVLPVLVEGWLSSEAFGATVRDMWAEVLLLRNDTFNQLPALGPLQGRTLDALYQGTVEEPLRFIEHLVLTDRPFTELVTADDMQTNEVTALIYGIDYDAAVGGWQASTWPDARPRAGILSSAQVWRRWESDGSNFNRGRANMVASRLLCEDFERRDIVIDGGIDIADELQVAHAVQVNPGCVSCHQSLDALSAYFWGYKQLIHRNYVADSITGGCAFNWAGGNEPEFGPSYLPEDYCYPLKQYNPADEGGWADWDLRAPSYYGQPAGDLAEVGRLIADDPRFSQCMARRFFGYLTQIDPSDVPFEVAVELQERFEASSFSAAALVHDVVMHPRFRAIASGDPEDEAVGLKTVRPEQYARAVEDLTGYRWWSAPDPPGCDSPASPDVQRFGTQCWGTVDLSDSDVFGFRAMSGGVDGKVILRPTHSPTPTKALAMATLAADAAARVVQTDLARAPSARRLLHLVEADTVAQQRVREQLAWLHARILGELAQPDDPAIDASLELFELGLQLRGEPAGAWTLVITALLQDPRMMFW